MYQVLQIHKKSLLEELSHVKPLTMFTAVENWNVRAVSGGNCDKYSVIPICTELSLPSEHPA